MLLLVPGHTHPSLHAVESKPDICVTIFVHGIMSVKPHLFTNMFRFINDNIDDSDYKNTITKIRNDSFLFNGQAMQGKGLQPINLQCPINSNGASAIATLFDHTRKQCSSQIQTTHHYYTFGWSGLFSPRARKKAAQDLYHALQSLIAQYRNKYKINPKIRLIGYSHGANVVAALGSLNHVHPAHVYVDELILLGMPIHKIEHLWLHSPLFKRIYNVYSFSDHVPYLDIFTEPVYFANKTFKNYCDLPLPDNFVQIELRVTRPKRGTKENKSALYHRREIISGKARTLRDASPGHIELWFLGWAGELYRKDFVLYPIPYIAFLPRFLEEINQRKEINPELPIVIDVRPYDERMIIREKYSFDTVQICPFLPQATLDELKSLSYNAQPRNYTLEKHLKHAEKYLDNQS